ncbi:hypothetical protein UFOVP661_49 [uncultured Caudovirales phage]|uniref:Uncharacterized protein n=1 Tax=uncultured Caudovirales phage TaxID=2100421 RepID=A0A6J5NM56_9CAUD|nr:hypothetical protein UFOVP661_49 [uncultured Caudovirales phage]
MNEEDLALEQALMLAQQAQGGPPGQSFEPSFFQPPSPEQKNVQQNDAMYYSQQLPDAPEPREALEQRIDPREMERLSIQGYMIPNKASDIKSDDQGTYPVDAGGNRLDWVRRPGILPVTSDQGELRAAMPYFLEQAGNMASGIVPVKGAGAILGSGPIRKAGQVAAEARASSVAPEGNIMMRPSISQYDLKGPETQTVESFLNQIKGMPGIPQETIEDIALRFHQNSPSIDLRQPVAKSEFESLFPPSKYNKVDLGTPKIPDPDDFFFNEAYRLANAEPEHVITRFLNDVRVPFLGYPERKMDVQAIQDVFFMGDKPIESLPEHVLDALYKNGINDQKSFSAQWAESRDNYIDEMRKMKLEEYKQQADNPQLKYTYSEDQRLVPQVTAESHPENYFEIGITHPDQKGTYTHFGAPPGDQPLVAHFRGQFLPRGGTILNEGAFKYETAGVTGSSIREKPSYIKAVPKSMVIEEIQSDVQKGIEQLGHLQNIHATAFKAAVQHGLENNVKTIYYPTAKTIAAARGMEAAKFSPIYDKEVVKQGINPLSKIPGVSMENLGGDYIKIDFTPDAIKYILKGPGQRLTNYDRGGEVNEYKPEPMSKIPEDSEAPPSDPIGDLLSQLKSYDAAPPIEDQISSIMRDRRDTDDSIANLLRRQEDEAAPLQEPSGKRFMDRALQTTLKSENVDFRPSVSSNWNAKWEDAMRDKYGHLKGELIRQDFEPAPVSRGTGSTPEELNIDRHFTRTSQNRADPKLAEEKGGRFAQDVAEMMFQLEKEGTRTPRTSRAKSTPRASGGSVDDKYASLDFSDVLPYKFG